MAYKDVVSADTPVSYWRLSDGGTSAADSAGTNTGTLHGTVTTGVAGALAGDSNTAMTFDGSTGYIEAPFAAGLNPSGAFSVECWARPTGGAATYRAAVSSRNIVGANTFGYIIYANGSDVWEAWLSDGSTAWSQATGSAVVLNSWVHLALTFNGTNTLLLYQNGAQSATKGITSYTANAVRPFRIGAGSNEGAASFDFPGQLDEVAFYNSTLSAAKVLSHYQSGTYPFSTVTVAASSN